MQSLYRTNGCRITEFTMQSMRCLTLENEHIRVTVLLDKGADIIEFRHKKSDIDFMWRSPMGLRSPTVLMPSRYDGDGNFLDYYEGGWQELFPNYGGPCTSKGALLGIHGEAFIVPWQCRIECDREEEVSVLLSARMMRTPFLLERRMTIRIDSSALFIDERAVNEGGVDMGFMWGHHPALGGPFLDGPVFIDIPAKKGGTSAVSVHPAIPADVRFDWPCLDNGNAKVDFSAMPAIEGKWACNCYANELTEGWCAVTNPGKGLGFGLSFDKDLFRNIWLWLVYNGLPDYPWYGRTRTVALEPYSSIQDNLTDAVAAGKGLFLRPGEEMTTQLCAAAYESTTRIKGVGKDGKIHK
jgi:hypothetical protein